MLYGSEEFSEVFGLSICWWFWSWKKLCCPFDTLSQNVLKQHSQSKYYYFNFNFWTIIAYTILFPFECPNIFRGGSTSHPKFRYVDGTTYFLSSYFFNSCCLLFCCVVLFSYQFMQRSWEVCAIFAEMQSKCNA